MGYFEAKSSFYPTICPWLVGEKEVLMPFQRELTQSKMPAASSRI